MTNQFRGWWLLAAALFAGCMSTPLDGDRAVHKSDLLGFSGYGSQPSQSIEIQAQQPGGGPFQVIATTSTHQAVLPTGGNDSAFAWSIKAAVPSWAWAPVPSCPTFNATVQAVAVASPNVKSPLPTFDDAGIACVTHGLDGAQSLAQAIAGCGSAKPVLLIAGPAQTHAGDVQISSQADADAIRCVEKIDGNLVVAPTALSIDIPNLREITGSLTMTSHSLPTASGKPANPEVLLPHLQRIGGSLSATFTYTPNDADFLPNRFGMPALDSVGGNVTLDMFQFDPMPSGLDSLKSVPGDVSLTVHGGSELASGVLEALQDIGGNLTVRSGSSTGPILARLQSVGGNMLIGPAIGATSYKFLGTTPFKSLKSVQGKLTITAMSSQAPLPSLHVGALVLDGNFFGGIPLPAPPAFVVGVHGPVTITNNATLCASAAAAFIGALGANGWMGVATSSGNDNGC